MRKRKQNLKTSNLRKKKNLTVQTAHFPFSTILNYTSSPPPEVIREPKHKSIRKSPLPRKASAGAWRSSVTEHKCTENGSLDYLFYTLFNAIVRVLSTTVREDDLTHAGRSIIKLRAEVISLVKTTLVRNNKNASMFSSVLSITSSTVQWILPPTCITAGDWTVEVTAFVVWDNGFKGVGTAFFINWVPEFLKKKSNNSIHTHAENSCQTSQWQNIPWS